MRNKKLIPFEVIEKAVAGEPEAVDAVLRHYTAHIKLAYSILVYDVITLQASSIMETHPSIPNTLLSRHK